MQRLFHVCRRYIRAKLLCLSDGFSDKFCIIMADILIYSGLGIMLIGSLYGIYVAIRGMRSRHTPYEQNLLTAFQFGPVSPEMKKLIIVWAIIMVVGLIITAIGLSI